MKPVTKCLVRQALKVELRNGPAKEIFYGGNSNYKENELRVVVSAEDWDLLRLALQSVAEEIHEAENGGGDE